MRIIYYLIYNFVFLFKLNILKFASALRWYIADLIKYKHSKPNENSRIKFNDLSPYLTDKTTKTEIEPIYFFQDLWLAENILKSKPKIHVDIGSSVKTIAIISTAVPTTYVDIRPPDVEIKSLNFIKGTVLHLPFKTSSLESVSSICVIEHIGLGRYGDKIDPWGTEKAIKELTRVIKHRGNLFISVPVDHDNKAMFNANRTFTREYILSFFAKSFNLIEEKYIYGKTLSDKYVGRKGFGTGLYHFRKK